MSAQTLYMISLIYRLPVLQIWKKSELKWCFELFFFHPSLVTDIGRYRQENLKKGLVKNSHGSIPKYDTVYT